MSLLTIEAQAQQKEHLTLDNPFFEIGRLTSQYNPHDHCTHEEYDELRYFNPELREINNLPHSSEEV